MPGSDWRFLYRALSQYDTGYRVYNQSESHSGSIILETFLSVFIILFTFQITGTIKNMILVYLANKKLDVVGHTMTEEIESSLSDTNA